MDNVFNTIKMGNPVKVFNFNNSSTDHPVESITGMYLAVRIGGGKTELMNMLVPKAVMNDLTDNSLLLFDRRHVYEVCLILDPILEWFQKAKYISNKDIIQEIFNTTIKCMTYAEFKSSINMLISKYKSVLPDYLYDSFQIVMEYIWFIPYNGINEIYTDAIEFYKKEKGITDESNN